VTYQRDKVVFNAFIFQFCTIFKTSVGDCRANRCLMRLLIRVIGLNRVRFVTFVF
jgi:hypothetical protein